jgi:CheY-like chemotaxis protein
MDLEHGIKRGGIPDWIPPADDGDDEPSERDVRPLAARRSSPVGKVAHKGCILIVDDDLSVRETLADLLELEGYTALQAADAVQALMILRVEAAVDALVTDLTMPGADGISLIRSAREFRSDLPAILLTGYAEEVTSVAMIAGGNFHVLRKPVESERLIEQLDLLVMK